MIAKLDLEKEEGRGRGEGAPRAFDSRSAVFSTCCFRDVQFYKVAGVH